MCDSENEMQGYNIDEIPVRKNILGAIGLQENENQEESNEILEEEMLKEGDYMVLVNQDGREPPGSPQGEQGAMLPEESVILKESSDRSSPSKKRSGGEIDNDSERRLTGKKKKRFDMEHKLGKLAAAAEGWGTGRFKSLR